MKKRITLMVWAVCGLSSLAQVAPPAAPTPADELGIGRAPGALNPKAATAPSALSAPPAAPELRGNVRTTAAGRFLSATSTTAGTSSYSQIPSLVLKFSEVDEGANDTMEEGLAIMTKLIEEDLKKGVGEGAVDKALGLDLVYTGSRSVRAMYMEGFGVLFMIKVNFPVYSPEKTKETKEAPPSGLSEWERAKRELYGQTSDRWAESGTVSSRSKYNPTQVETLKKLLMHTMTNTANIKGMHADEWVSFSVFGHPVAMSKTKKTAEKTSKKRTGSAVTALPAAGAGDETEPLPGGGLGSVKVNYSSSPVQVSQNGTVMTLRAKRSDIEAFAKGQLGMDDFAKVVQTQSYFGNGYGVLSVNSWLKDSQAR
jgi:hypothetical protein